MEFVQLSFTVAVDDLEAANRLRNILKGQMQGWERYHRRRNEKVLWLAQDYPVLSQEEGVELLNARNQNGASIPGGPDAQISHEEAMNQRQSPPDPAQNVEAPQAAVSTPVEEREDSDIPPWMSQEEWEAMKAAEAVKESEDSDIPPVKAGSERVNANAKEEEHIDATNHRLAESVGDRWGVWDSTTNHYESCLGNASGYCDCANKRTWQLRYMQPA